MSEGACGCSRATPLSSGRLHIYSMTQCGLDLRVSDVTTYNGNRKTSSSLWGPMDALAEVATRLELDHVNHGTVQMQTPIAMVPAKSGTCRLLCGDWEIFGQRVQGRTAEIITETLCHSPSSTSLFLPHTPKIAMANVVELPVVPPPLPAGWTAPQGSGKSSAREYRQISAESEDVHAY